MRSLARVHMAWQIPPASRRPLLIGALAVVLVALGYWWLSAPVATTAVPRVVRSAAVTTTDVVIVDVVGAVRHPGVVRLPADARVIDAVAAAGGVRDGRAPMVNMARPLVDGEQIVIGADAAGAARAAGGAAGATSNGGRISINSADVAALDALPGIGAVIAQRIVDYRTQHGPFRTVRDLLDVPGIGDAKYADIADAIAL